MSQINVDTIRNAAGSGGELSMSAGDFNFNSNTLFVDVSASQVGIGTGTPAALLDVRGSGGVMFNSTPLMEKVSIITGEINATGDIDLLTSSAWLFSTAGTADHTHNLRGDASTALNSIMEVGQAAVITLIGQLGASSGYMTGITIDGVSQTLNWLGGTAPSAAPDTSGWVAYTITIFKTANATFICFANEVRYA